jgi:hypothetical protein
MEVFYMANYIKQKYYRIEETIRILRDKGAKTEAEDLCSYTREGLIHPIIYINSLSAHACEKRQDGEALAVGHCFLSAYWDLGEEMTALLDTVTREKNIEVRPLVKKIHLAEEPKIFSWQYDTYVFQRVPPGHSCPKPQSEDLKLEFFILVPPERNKQTITLTVENFVITNRDLEFLITNIIGSDQLANDTPLSTNQDQIKLSETDETSNENTTPTNTYFSKIGEAGGEKTKLKEELLELAIYELKQFNRGFTNFKSMLESDYKYECFPSKDDATYEGHANCQDIFLIDERMHYTFTPTDKDKPERTDLAIRSLERYFTLAKKKLPQIA